MASAPPWLRRDPGHVPGWRHGAGPMGLWHRGPVPPCPVGRCPVGAGRARASCTAPAADRGPQHHLLRGVCVTRPGFPAKRRPGGGFLEHVASWRHLHRGWRATGMGATEPSSQNGCWGVFACLPAPSLDAVGLGRRPALASGSVHSRQEEKIHRVRQAERGGSRCLGCWAQTRAQKEVALVLARTSNLSKEQKILLLH